MAASPHMLLSSIRDPDEHGCRLLTTALQNHGIPCVLWGVSAAAHYGGGLCPLDIEIAINAADQQPVFELLTSHGLSVSSPDGQETKSSPPACLNDWEEAQTSAAGTSLPPYRDRRRTRLRMPIYELPPAATEDDPMDHFAFRTFVIVYSAEAVGLPTPIPSPPPDNNTPPNHVADPYLTLPAADSGSGSGEQLLQDARIPTYEALVRSEMHVLLMHASMHSPVWGQHMAQLSELVHSKARPDALENLERVVQDEKLGEFVVWFRASLKGEADYARLEGLQARYRRSCQLDGGHGVAG